MAALVVLGSDLSKLAKTDIKKEIRTKHKVEYDNNIPKKATEIQGYFET